MILDLDGQLYPSSEQSQRYQLPLRAMATQCVETTTSSGRTTPTIPSPTPSQTGSQQGGLPRQLRPLKSPLYVPAVLRPTEHRRRSSKSYPSPLTPPPSIHNFITDDVQSPRLLTRTMTNDSACLDSISEFEYGLESLGRVTALPSREHWKSDNESEFCDDASCTRYFSYFTRRHHCRRCGNIFCDTHSTYTIPLDQHADYHPRGTPSRACEHCYKGFLNWQYLRSSRSNSESSHDEDKPPTPTTPRTPSTPNINCAVSPGTPNVPCAGSRRTGYFPPKNVMEVGSVGGSVPRDWNWSTF